MSKSVIHSNQFIVIEVSKSTGRFNLVDTNSKNTYNSYPEALHEAQELAAYNKDSKFIVLAVAAVCETKPVNVPVVTTYRL